MRGVSYDHIVKAEESRLMRVAQRIKARQDRERDEREAKKVSWGRAVPGPLTTIQATILDHWFASGCGSFTKAMEKAGFPPEKNLFRRAQEMLMLPQVQEEIRRRRNEMSAAYSVDEPRIVAEMARIAFTSPGDLIQVDDDGSVEMDLRLMTPDHRACISEFVSDTTYGRHGAKTVRTRVKFASKQSALDSLARIMGMFKDKVEISAVEDFAARVQEARERVRGQVIEGELVDGPA